MIPSRFSSCVPLGLCMRTGYTRGVNVSLTEHEEAKYSDTVLTKKKRLSMGWLWCWLPGIALDPGRDAASSHVRTVQNAQYGVATPGPSEILLRQTCEC